MRIWWVVKKQGVSECLAGVAKVWLAREEGSDGQDGSPAREEIIVGNA